MINVSNKGGSQNFTAGQYGFTPGFTQPPVILPTNPGMQYTPPPSFTSTVALTQTGGQMGKSVDCVVRDDLGRDAGGVTLCGDKYSAKRSRWRRPRRRCTATAAGMRVATRRRR